MKPGSCNLHVLQYQHNVKKRCAADVALNVQFLHDLFKGNILVAVSFYGCPAGSVDHFSKRGGPAQVCAQREHVDEAAQDVFEFFPCTSCNRSADRYVVLAGILA